MTSGICSAAHRMRWQQRARSGSEGSGGSGRSESSIAHRRWETRVTREGNELGAIAGADSVSIALLAFSFSFPAAFAAAFALAFALAFSGTLHPGLCLGLGIFVVFALEQPVTLCRRSRIGMPPL